MRIVLTELFFTVRGCYTNAQPPNWKTTPCRLSGSAYSMHLQPSSIAGGRSSIRIPRKRHAVVTREPPNSEMGAKTAELGYTGLEGKATGRQSDQCAKC
jgi:hypothetical protein